MRGSRSWRGGNHLEFIGSCERVFQVFWWGKVAFILQIKDDVYSSAARSHVSAVVLDAAGKGNCWSYGRFGPKGAAARADYLKLTLFFPHQHSLCGCSHYSLAMPFKNAKAVCGRKKKQHQRNKTEVSMIQRKSQSDIILAGAAQRLEDPCNPFGGVHQEGTEQSMMGRVPQHKKMPPSRNLKAP